MGIPVCEHGWPFNVDESCRQCDKDQRRAIRARALRTEMSLEVVRLVIELCERSGIDASRLVEIVNELDDE